MAAKIGGDDDQPIADINIVPFVDIILVVLIIFMATASIITNPSIKINLPKAASGEETTPSQLSISIAANGETQLNGKAVSDEEISKIAKETLQTNPQIQAIIAADENASHGRVMTVIDVVKTAGILKFAMSTEKKK